MKQKILVTDTLFIDHPSVLRLEEAGFEVRRLEKLKATEEELCDALNGCTGYILGGIEHVTTKVIEAAKELKVIVFTGSGYSEFIPAHKTATERGIAICTAKGANAPDVAEFTVGMLFEMCRHFQLLRTRNGSKGNSFKTASRISGKTIAVFGYGAIGREVAKRCHLLGMNVVIVGRHNLGPLDAGIEVATKKEALSRADIVSVHVDKISGLNAISREDVYQLRPGSIILNAAFPEAIDIDATLERVARGEIRVAFDAPPDRDLTKYDIDSLCYSNAQSAFNTAEAIQATNERCVSAMIEMLSGKTSGDLVNPDYALYRAKKHER